MTDLRIDCVHCGAATPPKPIVWNNLNFCCNGCQTVYQLLHQHQLYDYYKIETTPGVKLEHETSSFAYLDNDEIRRKLLTFSDGDYSRVTLYIPAIHCSSCIWLLENMHKLHQGIKQSAVHFIRKEVDITFNHTQISLRQIAELLASVHYVPYISLQDVEEKRNRNINKQLLYKIGIAGFVFGNVMLFSFAEYVPGGEELEHNFRQYFGILNILLSLPVFFYSASDYLLGGWKTLRNKQVTLDLPIAVGILALMGQSLYEIISRTGPGYIDSLAGFVFFMLIGKWYQSKTYQALSFERDYKSYFPVAVTKMEGAEEKNTLLRDLKKGDRIVIRNRELIPADAILIKGSARIDYSFVTGEAQPVVKNSGDEIYAGGRQMGQSIELEIVKDVAQSRLTQLWNQHSDNEQNKSLNTIIDAVSKRFTIGVLVAASLTALYWWYTDTSVLLRAVVSVLIVACPCAVSLSVPFTFGSAMRLMGRKGFYLKKTAVVENLSNINAIVFDKTGTITQAQDANVSYHGNSLNNEYQQMLRSLTRHSTHPLSKLVHEHLPTSAVLNVEDFNEIEGQGIQGYINGIEIKLGSLRFVSPQTPLQTQQDNLLSKVHISFNKAYQGYFAISNKYREGLNDIIKQLSQRYELHLLSGDNDSERTNLEAIFGTSAKLHFNQSPNDKLQYIQQLRQQNKNVLMVGDGLNDAGALSAANTGIAIADDVHSFSPACDGILESKQFSLLQRFIVFARQSGRVVRISFAISVMYNLTGLSFAVQGLLSPIIAAIIMPVSSVTVVGFVTLSVTLLAQKTLNK